MKTDKALFREALNDELWQKIKESPKYASQRKNLCDAWNISCEKPLMPVSFDAFMAYKRTGSRREFSKEYFAKRLALNSSFVSYMIYREDKYLNKLENILMNILDEYTWSDPGHIGELCDAESVSTFIDLFAAETGQALSEILYLIGDKLDTHVSTRIRYEVNRRIINSFINKRFPFEDSMSNWATVCSGSVGMTFIYMAPEKFSLIKERVRSCFLNYLSGFGDDGACAEGVGYWVYGFGYYLYFEELYKEFSGDYLIPIGEKHKEIAMFMQRAHIGGKSVISFSDGSQEEFIMSGVVFKANEIFGDCVRILPKDAYAPPVMGGDNCYRFAHCIRNFLWYNPDKLPKSEERVNETVFLENSQWYIKRNASYVFAAKGGWNDDPHNHNDVGSFLISDGRKQLLADIGKGEYNSGYFKPETRYDNFCCASRGHSLPIIDGIEQSPGREYRGKILENNNDFVSMDISGAYDNENLTAFVRSFSFKDKSVILTDEITQNNPSVWTERFISLIEPVVGEASVRIENLTIHSSIKTAPTVKVEKMYGHFEHILIPVYIIDYNTDERKVEFRFEME